MTETRENVAHYNTGDIETIDYIADKLTPEEFRAYVVGNLIKYSSRALHKGQFESDIEKIRNYSVILQEFEAKQPLIAEEVWEAAVVEEPPAMREGARVRVVRSENTLLEDGTEHTVLRCEHDFVYLETPYLYGGWLADRFEVIG